MSTHAYCHCQEAPVPCGAHHTHVRQHARGQGINNVEARALVRRRPGHTCPVDEECCPYRLREIALLAQAEHVPDRSRVERLALDLDAVPGAKASVLPEF